MRFGEIKDYILFGGGRLLCQTAMKLRNEKYPVFVVTSQRHSVELFDFDEATKTLADHLKAQGIEYIITNNISNEKIVVDRITAETIGISFSAAWIFKDHFIRLFSGRLLNCHGTRLPQDRGAGGFSWRILRGERLGISLIHQIDPGIDTGNIIFFKEYMFPHYCRTPLEYQNYSDLKYQELIDDFLRMVSNNCFFDRISQQEYFSSYWPRLATDIHGYIDWGWSLRDIEKFICAFDDPYNGASTFLNGKKVRLKDCSTTINDGLFHPFQNGMVYRISKDAIHVATEHGTLLLKKVLDDNGVDIGSEVEIGYRFYTPSTYLEKAKEYRAYYTPNGLK